jgi:hypothetical protein
MLDDVFAETARVDCAYQVFLQACGDGSVYVEAKCATHFVVKGTPNLSFDWEIKAHQADLEYTRLENRDLNELVAEQMSPGIDVDEIYAEELAYAELLEGVLNEAA